jgi:hypothetical protein
MQSTKNAALLALGFLSAGLGLLDSARCQTSLAPPLSLTRPAPALEETAPPPPIIRASPPVSSEDATPPTAPTKRAAPPKAAEGASQSKAGGRREKPVAATADAPPPKPAADYDGLTAAGVDEPVQDLPANTAASNRSKRAKDGDSVTGERSTEAPEDAALKRKLTICRDCK